MKMIKNLLWMLVALIAISTGCKKEKKEVFATVNTTAVSGITGSAAVTGGSITNTGNSAISQSGIVFATHTMPTLTDSLRNNTSGGNSFTINLTALNAKTIYYARAFAINATGTAYGNQITFTTLAGVPTVTTTTIGAISPGSATGQAGGDITNDGGAPVTARGVVWGTSPNPTISGNKTADSTGTGAFKSTFGLFLSNTKYYYRAYATNSYGTGYGNQLSFTAGSTNTVADIDGNVYGTVTIGSQTWMTSNLKVTHYRNGDPIINGFKSNFDWYNNYINSLYVGAYTYPNGDSTLTNGYGLLYNVDAVNDKRNLAPPGWHVATDADWETFEYNEGMLATDTASINVSRNYTNPIGPLLLPGGTSGFNAQLGGRMAIASSGVTYQVLNIRFYYWTSTEKVPTGYIANWIRFLGPQTNVERAYTNTIAASVRCIKD